MAKQHTLVVLCENEDVLEQVSAYIENNYASYVSLRTDGDMWDLTAEGAEGKRELWQIVNALRAKFGRAGIEAHWDDE